MTARPILYQKVFILLDKHGFMAIYRNPGKVIFITALAIAMAFLETSVVVYLRELYYPKGFSFPLAVMPSSIAVTELLREFATLVMLISIGFIAGINRWQRFAWFLYSFAIWDIFYYVFLKWLIDWPSSWYTWDILFLLPVAWTGPVLAPVIVSVSMIILAIVILLADRNRIVLRVRWPESLLVLTGAVVIFISFILDFMVFVIRDYSLVQLFSTATSAEVVRNYTPVSYNWFLLLAGEIFIFSGIVVFLAGNKKTLNE
jgi:hypothetical protein